MKSDFILRCIASLTGGVPDLERFAVYPNELTASYEIPDKIGASYLLTGPRTSSSTSTEIQEEQKTADK